MLWLGLSWAQSLHELFEEAMTVARLHEVTLLRVSNVRNGSLADID